MNRTYKGLLRYLVFFAIFLVSATSIAFGTIIPVGHSPLERQFGIGRWEGFDYNLCVGVGIRLCGHAGLHLGGDLLTVSERGTAILDTDTKQLSFLGSSPTGGEASMYFGIEGGLEMTLCIDDSNHCLNLPVPFGYTDWLLADTAYWTPYFPDSRDPIYLNDFFPRRELFPVKAVAFPPDSVSGIKWFEGGLYVEGALGFNQTLTPLALTTSAGDFAFDGDTQTIGIDCAGPTVSNIVKKWNWEGGVSAAVYLTARVDLVGITYEIVWNISRFDFNPGITATFSTDPESISFPGDEFGTPIISGYNPNTCGGQLDYTMSAAVTGDNSVSWSWTANHGYPPDDFYFPDSSTPSWQAPFGYTGPITITATASKSGCSKSSSVTVYVGNAPTDPQVWITEACNFIDVNWTFPPERTGAKYYRIYRDGASMARVESGYTWRDTIPGTSSHCYEVQAWNDCDVFKSFPRCGTVNSLLPAKPGTVYIYPADHNELLLRWFAANGAVEYCLYRDGVLSGCLELPLERSRLLSLVVAAADTLEHCYTVTAKNDCGESPESESTCAVAGPAACRIAVAGDVYGSSAVNSTDIIHLVNYVLKAGSGPLPCPAAGDANCNGVVNSTDIIYLVNYVLKAGPAPCDICAMIPGTWNCP